MRQNGWIVKHRSMAPGSITSSIGVDTQGLA
jgi:hypothetical protein